MGERIWTVLVRSLSVSVSVSLCVCVCVFFLFSLSLSISLSLELASTRAPPRTASQKSIVLTDCLGRQVRKIVTQRELRVIWIRGGLHRET